MCSSDLAPDACPQARPYLQQVNLRREKESQTLASLTGWDINRIRKTYGVTRPEPDAWQRLFNVMP